MIKSIFYLITLFTLLILPIPSLSATIDTRSEMLARWEINYADLLVDEGKYFEAIEHVNQALKNTKTDTTISDALLRKANIQSRFLDAEEEAIYTYSLISNKFPALAEFSLYQQCQLYFQISHYEKAKEKIQEYVNKYPKGNFFYQLEVLLDYIQKVTPTAPVLPFIEEPCLRVALAKRTTRVSINPTDNADLSVNGARQQQPIKATTANGQISINGKLKGTSVAITSTAPIKITLGSKKKTVRGKISLLAKGNKLLVLNIIPIEEYLLSVVPSESYASWPINSLRAQAVAARTYAYYQKLHRKNLEYDVRADTFDQMYQGVSREHKRTTQAVHDTAGRILIHNNRPILAQYTANSGGFTADAGAIFDTPKPYLVAHKDPASLQGKMTTWKKEFTLSEIEHKLSTIGISTPKLRAIQPVKKGPSGRITHIRLIHANGSRTLNTRTTLASSRVLKLPDILLQFEEKNDSVIFYGKGHGHGVGLSQWGCATLGKSHSFEDILSFYYPQTQLKKSWK